MTRVGRRVAANGQSIAIGGSVHGDIDVDITNITNMIERESYPGLSIEPPTGRLPGRLRGREEICAGIAALIDSYAETRHAAAPLVLSGLGGVGKSAVALYACQYAIASDVSAFWLSSATGAPISVSLWRVARELAEPDAGLPESSSQDGIIDLVWRVLEATSKPWLVVFDNADDPQGLAADGHGLSAGNGWARASGNGLVIVTSRLADPGAWPDGFQTVILESLSSDSGADLLLDLVSAKHPNALGEREDAIAVAERLGGLPLAMRAAGRYIDQTATAAAGIFADYTRALDSRFAAVLDVLPDARQDSTAAANRESVLATWSLSVEHLVDSGYRQVPQIMNILSCLDPSGIPPSLIGRVQDYLAPLGTADLAAGPDLLATLRAMRNFGLVDVALSQQESLALANDRAINDNSTMHVHRLVADVFDHTLREIPQEARSTYAATIKTLVTVMAHAREMGSAGVLDASLVTPHCARVARSAFHSPELYNRGELRQFIKAIGGVCELMFYLPPSDSLGMLQQFLALAESVMRRHAKPVRQIRHSLAHEFWKAKENDQAMRLLVDSQHGWYRLWCKLLPGILHAQLASLHSFSLPGAAGEIQADVTLVTLRTIKRMPYRSTSNSLKHRLNLATMLAKQGHADIAEAELRKIVEAYERRGPKYQLEELRARAFLADALRVNGKLAESEQQYKGVLGAGDRILPESDLIGPRFGLAVILHLRGENDTAANQFRQALDDATRILGATNPSTITTSWWLARALLANADYDEAERLLRNVLKAREQAQSAATVGNIESDTADTSVVSVQLDLGQALAGKGDLAAAEELYRAILRELADAGLEDDKQALTMRSALAALLKGRQDLMGAEAEYRQLLAANLRVHPADPATTFGRFQLGLVLRDRGDLDGAETELRQVVRELEKAHGSDDKQTRDAREVLAELLSDRRNWPDAADEFRLLLSADLRTVPDDKQTREARHALGHVLEGGGDLDGAAAEFRAVVEFDEQHPGSPPLLTRKAWEDLIRVLAAQQDLAGLEVAHRALLAADLRERSDTPYVRVSRFRLGKVLAERGELAGAEAEFREATNQLERALGNDDEQTLAARSELVNVLMSRRDVEAAAAELEKLVSAYLRVGPDQPRNRKARCDLGRLLLALGRTSAAEAEFRAVVNFDEQHPEVPAEARLFAWNDMVTVLRASSDLAGLAIAYRELLAVNHEVRPDAPQTRACQVMLAQVLRDNGDLAGAESELRDALGSYEQALGVDDSQTAQVAAMLAQVTELMAAKQRTEGVED